MTCVQLETQCLQERTAATIQIPLTDEAGDPLTGPSVDALTITMTSLDTGASLITPPRDVKPGLGATTVGTLDVALSSDDLVMLMTRAIERRVLTVSILYASSKEDHIAIPLTVTRVPGAYDMTP